MSEVDKMVNISIIQGMQRRKNDFYQCVKLLSTYGVFMIKWNKVAMSRAD